jgi:hypothetical protein
MGSCALGTCTNPTCPMCVELPRRFPPIERCRKHVKDGERRVACRFVAGHRGYCQPMPKKRDRDPRLWDVEAS